MHPARTPLSETTPHATPPVERLVVAAAIDVSRITFLNRYSRKLIYREPERNFT